MRLAPDPVIRRRALAGANLLRQAETMRVTSAMGTDLTCNVKDRVVLGLYSLADEPGRWDNWPSGMVTVGPDEFSANGTLVLDINDVILRLGRYVTAPVKMTLRDGLIVKIEGGLDARLLEDWFAAFNDETAYRIAHIGWGCEHRADWNRMGAYLMEGAVQDQEAYYGNMQNRLRRQHRHLPRPERLQSAYGFPLPQQEHLARRYADHGSGPVLDP